MAMSISSLKRLIKFQPFDKDVPPLNDISSKYRFPIDFSAPHSRQLRIINLMSAPIFFWPRNQEVGAGSGVIAAGRGARGRNFAEEEFLGEIS